jgi:hypothetical protein
MLRLTCAAVLLATALPALAENQPFMITSPINSATPFNVTLPATTADGKPVKTVVIEFITADCLAVTGLSSIGAGKLTVYFHSSNGFYALPFGPAMSFVNATEFAAAQPTLIFADPGTPLNFGLTADQPTCTVVFSGHLQ